MITYSLQISTMDCHVISFHNETMTQMHQPGSLLHRRSLIACWAKRMSAKVATSLGNVYQKMWTTRTLKETNLGVVQTSLIPDPKTHHFFMPNQCRPQSLFKSNLEPTFSYTTVTWISYCNTTLILRTFLAQTFEKLRTFLLYRKLDVLIKNCTSLHCLIPGHRPDFILPDRKKYVSMERQYLKSYMDLVIKVTQ